MSQTISGVDVSLETSAAAFDLLRVLDVLLDFWPAAQFLDANADSAQPLRAVAESERAPSSSEFFIYRDPDSAASWAEEGSTPQNANTMVHCLIQPIDGRADGVRLTLVVDRLTAEMTQLVSAIERALESARDAARPRPRMRLQRELQVAGVKLGPDEFGELLDAVRESLFGLTADELVCNPHLALQFSQIVQDKVGVHLPEHVILKAMLNRRRQARR